MKGPIKIVVADDCKPVCRQLCSLLEAESEFVVLDVVHDGCEAVQTTLKHGPDVVILDINMPLVDGIEATREIRKRSAQTQILALSICLDIEIISHMLEVGAMGFLQKSLAPEEIIKAIRDILRHKIYLSPRMVVPVLDYLVGSSISHNIVSSLLTSQERSLLRALAQINTQEPVDIKINSQTERINTLSKELEKKLDFHQFSDLIEFSQRHYHLF